MIKFSYNCSCADLPGVYDPIRRSYQSDAEKYALPVTPFKPDLKKSQRLHFPDTGVYRIFCQDRTAEQ